MRWGSRLGVGFVAAAAVGLAPTVLNASTALASTFSVGSVAVSYAARPGEKNDVTLSSGTVTVTHCTHGEPVLGIGETCTDSEPDRQTFPFYVQVSDPGAFVHPGSGQHCARPQPRSIHSLYCFFGDPRSDHPVTSMPATAILVMSLRDGADKLEPLGVQFRHPVLGGVVSGGPGSDVLDAAGAANITLAGGAGNDTIIAPADACAPIHGRLPKRVDGGPGEDRISFAQQSPECGRDPAGSPAVPTGLELDLANMPGVTHVEDVDGTPGQDTITGDGHANRINGLGGTDTIKGGPGNDVLIGGGGGDALYGGPGNDVVQGSSDGDLLDGGDGNDKLYGGDGDNTFSDGAGNDLVVGGANQDTVKAGPGRDTYKGGQQACAGCIGIYIPTPDTISFAGYDQGVRVSQDGSPNDGAPGEHKNVTGFETIIGGSGPDVLSGSGAVDELDGGAGDDRLYGNGGSDLLDGGAGTDKLFGNAGDDFLSGGTGPDALHGGPGTDTASYSERKAGVTVTLDNVANDGNAADENGATASQVTQTQPITVPLDDVFRDVENVVGTSFDDNLTGSFARNGLDGLGGNDVLSGLGNADNLQGGPGDDQLTGGPGIDTFDCGDGANDRVTDRVPMEMASACELFAPPG